MTKTLISIGVYVYGFANCPVSCTFSVSVCTYFSGSRIDRSIRSLLSHLIAFIGGGAPVNFERGLKNCNTDRKRIKTGFCLRRSNLFIVDGSNISQCLAGGGWCKLTTVDHVPSPKAELEPFFQKPTKKEVWPRSTAPNAVREPRATCGELRELISQELSRLGFLC